MAELRTSSERINSIINNTNEKFYFVKQNAEDIKSFKFGIFENRVNLSPTIPVYLSLQDNYGAGQFVRSRAAVIEAAATEFNVSSDLVKGVIYTELSRGWYDWINPFGSSTILPGNVNPIWAQLIPGVSINNETDNIRVTAKLLSEIGKRLDDPRPEDIYALYNSMSHDKTYENAETKNTPYFLKEVINYKAWQYEKFMLPNVPWAQPVNNAPRCFVAGTLITMADGTKKPIEEIDAGDMVMSFDPDAENGLGALVPGKVTRTFRNTTRVLIDLWGLRVTPGHEFLADRGEWMSVADILRRDRAIVREVDGLPTPIRARTNCPLGGDEDVVFLTIFHDPRTGLLRHAQVRGCKMFSMRLMPDAPVVMREPVSLIETLRASGVRWTPDGSLFTADGKRVKAVQWPDGRTPFDTGDDAGAIVTLDGEPFTPDWIANIPRDGEETRAVMNAGGGPEDSLLVSPWGMATMKMGGDARAFNPPAPRQTMPAQRPSLATFNPSAPAPNGNRAQRRRQAALHRVK